MSLKWIIYLALIYCGIIIAKNHPLSLLMLISCFVLFKLITRRKTPSFRSLEKQLILLRNSIDSFNSIILNSGTSKNSDIPLNTAFIKPGTIKHTISKNPTESIKMNHQRNNSYRLYSYLDKINRFDSLFD
jgi:hypothetical protein